MQHSREALQTAYRQMKTIRMFEDRLHDEIALGEIAGFTHLYAGQEACAVGVCEHLGARDFIISTHRGHGHCIAKGCDVVDMMKEIYGSSDGLCKGKGGSMHIADVNKGMLGANGIVGAGAPIAVGAGITARSTGNVSIAFSGDGACNQGTTFEAMNMAVVLKLPVIFVFENNRYSEHTGEAYAVGAESMTTRAAAFGMKAIKANGIDFFAVYDAMQELIDYCKAGNGPASIELDTERFFGHFEGDPQRYRGKGELDRIREERDCLKVFRQKVTEAKLLEHADLDRLDEEVTALIDRAVAEAKSAPRPTAEHVLEDVYISY
ncbi:MAG: thiamine pyrophosphate-dependent dehydrogenase E1 component subunit alpha [Sphingomonadaceae bacterium]